MEFTTATLAAFDTDSFRFVTLRHVNAETSPSGERDRLTYIERDNSQMGRTGVILRSSGTVADDDGDPKLLDSNTIWSPTVAFIGDRVYVTGFMRGTQGVRQNGLCPKHGEPHCSEDEEGEGFVRVEWALS